jgi:hypothetical protein
MNAADSSASLSILPFAMHGIALLMLSLSSNFIALKIWALRWHFPGWLEAFDPVSCGGAVFVLFENNAGIPVVCLNAPFTACCPREKLDGRRLLVK